MARSGALCRTRRRLITCEGLVNGGHTLFGRSAQVLYEIHGEEVEGVRQEVREVSDEENGEINRTHHERMWMG